MRLEQGIGVAICWAQGTDAGIVWVREVREACGRHSAALGDQGGKAVQAGAVQWQSRC